MLLQVTLQMMSSLYGCICALLHVWVHLRSVAWLACVQHHKQQQEVTLCSPAKAAVEDAALPGSVHNLCAMHWFSQHLDLANALTGTDVCIGRWEASDAGMQPGAPPQSSSWLHQLGALGSVNSAMVTNPNVSLRLSTPQTEAQND